MNLAETKCEPCRGGVSPLSPGEARTLATETPEWTLADATDRITREFTFGDFVEAMAFVNRVADLAEAEGHHPDFAIHYRKVQLTLWTHKIGGLHRNDFIMAAKIDGLVPK